MSNTVDSRKGASAAHIKVPLSPLPPGFSQVATRKNPLYEHSLRGDAAKLRANAVSATPVLGDFIMRGQFTMIWSPPNAGKTITAMYLVRDSAERGIVDPDQVIYICADDSSQGAAEKAEILEEIGAHIVVPSFKGFKINQFTEKLAKAIAEGTARETIIIIDTLKKFTNLMDKSRSSEFAQLCREYVMAGGTIVALGHTAKNGNADGTLRYQGTTDILDDCDAAYIAQSVTSRTPDERIIKFTQNKSRADSPEVTAYAYSTERGLSYRDKVTSMRLVYPEELEGHSLWSEQASDEDVIQDIRGYLVLGHGKLGQEKIVKALASSGSMSRGTVRRVLDKYTGSDPSKHLWNYTKGDRGLRMYHLIDRPTPEV